MYLKGYKIKTYNDSQSITLPKWDFGGDKPWTNKSWHKTLETIREINEDNYPLFVLDLDNSELSETQINDKSAFEAWLKESMR